MASVEVPEITMRPPNLKIWGGTHLNRRAGHDPGRGTPPRDRFRRGGLTSDTTITLYTEMAGQ